MPEVLHQLPSPQQAWLRPQSTMEVRMPQGAPFSQSSGNCYVPVASESHRYVSRTMPLPGRKRRRLPEDVTERVIVHMNKDHSNSVLHFAKHYGKVALANAATIVAMDYEGQLAICNADRAIAHLD